MIGALVIVVLFSLVIAFIFLSLFDEATLATLHSFAIDQDLNGDPKYGPPSYHEKLDKVYDRKRYAKVSNTGNSNV